MGSTEKFCLRWNDFEANISSAFCDLKEEKDFSDVTLVCADQHVEAHRVILAACSPFFKKVLRKVQHSHPLIYLKGVEFSDLEAVLSFVYHGEVNVEEADLKNFLAVAEELEVKGLACGKNFSEGNSNHLQQSNTNHQSHSRSNHKFQSTFNHWHQPYAPPPSQVRLQTLPQNEQKWPTPASENNNAVGAAYAQTQRESDSSQLVNTPKAPLEEVEHAGFEDFSQERGEGVDLNNHFERISEGVNCGQFKCKICGHVSSQKANLQRHVESKHFPGLFEYSCDLCEKNFNTISKYHTHRSRFHHSNRK